ncbi:MAG TPA: cytochrome c [Burkholderiaceae bacterium]|nr:cytochrome c [Burkholderiaceae bacterium]
MSMHKAGVAAIAAALLTLGCANQAGQSGQAHKPSGERYGLGKTPTAQEIAGWNIDIAPDGVGLPPGSGTVAQGRALYAAQCAACHGANGQGGTAARLVGGQGTLTSEKPVLTIGSYWPYATTLYDYINRAMPWDRPQSLKPNEVYALTAFLLHMNGIVDANASLDATSLPKVAMPNRNGFTRGDPRPGDVKTTRCMQNCS